MKEHHVCLPSDIYLVKEFLDQQPGTKFGGVSTSLGYELYLRPQDLGTPSSSNSQATQAFQIQKRSLRKTGAGLILLTAEDREGAIAEEGYAKEFLGNSLGIPEVNLTFF